MPRRMLITGATGGLGLGLVSAARAAGHDVVATGRSTASAERIAASGASFVQADLTDPQAALRLCMGRESIIHAAALSASWGRGQDFERINVSATGALLDAAQKAGCSRFVFVSSPSIYAAYRDRIGIRGSDAPSRPPLNHYARSKLAAEELVLSARGQMQTCIIRPRAIVGPDDKVLLPTLIALVKRARVPLLRGGKALIELTDVRDAAKAIVDAEACIDIVDGRGINISGGRPISVLEIATALAAVLRITPRFVKLPMVMARLIARSAEAKAELTGSSDEPLLTRYALATLGFTQTFDAAESARLIGYSPQHDALTTLLAQAARYAG